MVRRRMRLVPVIKISLPAVSKNLGASNHQLTSEAIA